MSGCRHGNPLASRCDSCRLAVAEAIVRDLASNEPIMSVYNGGYYDECALCGANDLEQTNAWLTTTDPKDYDKRPEFPLAHTESCPWRRAVEYVNSSNHKETK